jgi:Gpi18-like mannosyltransferase
MLADDVYVGRYAEAEDQLETSGRIVRPVFPRNLPGGLDRSALVAAMQTFTVTRTLLFVVTFLAMALHPSVWGAAQPSSATFWDAWYQWDARWYVKVAAVGYHFSSPLQWSSVAFFPLYPLLIHAAAILPLSRKLLAMLIANGCFFLATYVLYRLVRREFSREVATRTLFSLAMFPTAIFFFAGYSEGTFLLFSVLAFAAMRQRAWLWAALWSGLAAATRSQGILLTVPFAVELWQAYRLRWESVPRWLLIGIVPMGWVGFALYLHARFGNGVLFITSQRAWHRTTTWPWEGIWLTLAHMSWRHLAAAIPAHNLIDLCVVLIFGVLIWVGWQSLPLSYSLYAVAYLGSILVNPAVLDGYYAPLMSASRLCLMIFPCFITLSRLGMRSPLLDRLVSSLNPALMALFAVIFLQGAWVA